MWYSLCLPGHHNALRFTRHTFIGAVHAVMGTGRNMVSGRRRHRVGHDQGDEGQPWWQWGAVHSGVGAWLRRPGLRTTHLMKAIVVTCLMYIDLMGPHTAKLVSSSWRIRGRS